MGRIFAWFSGLSVVKKALIVACALLVAVLFSPLIVPLAALVLLISLVVVVYRMRRQRPFRGPGILLLSSVAALILASGASAALYEAFDPAEARRLCEKLEIHYTPKHGS